MGVDGGTSRVSGESFDHSRGGGGDGGGCGSKHVVVVMDALREFSTKPLEWALDYVVEPGNTLTLLGVMPWLSLPMLCKTWLDIWTLDLGDLSNPQDRAEWKNDPRHQRLRTIVELCEARGMKVVMGHPVRLMVLEQTTNLHATWIVFDRYQRKRKSFYKRRIPCNMVMMKGSGQVEVLRVKSDDIPTSSRSSASRKPSTELINSKEWIEFLEKESKKWEVARISAHFPS